MKVSSGARTAELAPRSRAGSSRSSGVVSHLPPGVEEIAVVDIGSNTARLAIYRAAPSGPPWTVFESKETPRLMTGTDAVGRLRPEATSHLLGTLDRFRRILDDRGVRRRRVVATSAVRDAPNRSHIVAQVRRRTGLPLEILSGESEARIAYMGVASALPLSDNLLIDLGGGSLQLSRISEGRFEEAVSLPLGALRVHQLFLEHDPPKNREIGALADHADEMLASVEITKRVRGLPMVGVGGTVRGLAHLLQAAKGYPLPRVHGYPLMRRDLDALGSILAETSVEVRKSMPGMSADRADIIYAGLVVILRLMRAVSADEIVVSGCGLREGLAYQMLGRPLPPTPDAMARDSARAAAWAFGLSQSHGARVRDLALDLYDLLEAGHDLEPELRLGLEVAALLHDAGTMVSYPEHAQHSSYLLQNHPLYGLSHRQLLLASLAVGLHEGDELEGSLVKRYRSLLSESEVLIVRQLGAMLALAEALGEGRPRPLFRLHGDRLMVMTSSGEAPSPRTFERARRLLKRTFGVDARLRPRT